MNLQSFVSTLACAVGITASPAAAAVVPYSDQASFFAALPGDASIVTETFDTPASSREVLTFSGVTSTISNPRFRHQIGFFTNIFEGTVAAAQDTRDGPVEATTVTWDLPSGVFAVGFDIEGAAVPRFSGVQVTADDGTGERTFLVYDVLGGTELSVSGYFGIIGDAPLGSILLSGAPGGVGISSVNIDNASFVSQPEVIPLPAPALTLMAGLGALGGLRAWRRKRTSA